MDIGLFIMYGFLLLLAAGIFIYMEKEALATMPGKNS